MLTEFFVAMICFAGVGGAFLGYGLWQKYRWGYHHRESLQNACYAVSGIMLALSLVSGIASLQLFDFKSLKDGVASEVTKNGFTVTGPAHTVIDGQSWTIPVKPTPGNHCTDTLFVEFKQVNDHRSDYVISKADDFPSTPTGERCYEKLDN